MHAAQYANKIIELIRAQSYTNAENLINEALELYPTNQFLLKNEIFILTKLNKMQMAREKAESSYEALKHDHFFLKSYFFILEKVKAKSDIENMIERTISVNIINDESFYIFLASLAGRVFDKSKSFDILKRAISLLETNTKLKTALNELEKKDGHASMYQYYKEKFSGKKPADAIAELEKIKTLTKYKDDYDLNLYLAELYKKTGKYDKTIETYKFLLSIKDNEFTRKMLGYAYYKTHDYENALVYLKDPFIKCPEDNYLTVTINNIFKQKKDFEGYKFLIEEILSLHPNAKNLYGDLKKAEKWQKN